MKKRGTKFALLSILLIVMGIVFCILGFYKKNTYENYEGYSNLSKNAYVGGDAYNYIINGTYFAGYEALGGCLLLLGGIMIIGSSVVNAIDDLKDSKPAVNGYNYMPYQNPNIQSPNNSMPAGNYNNELPPL